MCWVINRPTPAHPAHQGLIADSKVQLLRENPLSNNKTSVLSLDNHSLDHFQSYPLTPPQSPTHCSLPQDASFAQATEFARSVLGHPRDQKESSKGMPEVQTQEMQSTCLPSMIWRPVLMSTSAKDQSRAPAPFVRFTSNFVAQKLLLFCHSFDSLSGVLLTQLSV